MEAKLIANVILDQIKAGGLIKMMSWGAHGFAYLTEDQNPGLIFKVNGFIHKGRVKVILMGNDTYTVSLHKARSMDQVGDAKTRIYCDQLTDVIDGMVEFSGNKAEYDEQVTKATYKI